MVKQPGELDEPFFPWKGWMNLFCRFYNIRPYEFVLLSLGIHFLPFCTSVSVVYIAQHRTVSG